MDNILRKNRKNELYNNYKLIADKLDCIINLLKKENVKKNKEITDIFPDYKSKTTNKNTNNIATLEDRLEELKKIGAYSITLYYGEGIGCDDSDVSQLDRDIRIIFCPAGVLGEAKCMIYYKLRTILLLDFSLISPIVTHNPPFEKEIKNYGYYIWGSEDAVNIILNKKEK